MENNLIKDITAVLAVLAVLVASFYLVSIGIGLLFFIGFIIPGWVVLLILMIILYRRHKKR